MTDIDPSLYDLIVIVPTKQAPKQLINVTTRKPYAGADANSTN